MTQQEERDFVTRAFQKLKERGRFPGQEFALSGRWSTVPGMDEISKRGLSFPPTDIFLEHIYGLYSIKRQGGPLWPALPFYAFEA